MARSSTTKTQATRRSTTASGGGPRGSSRGSASRSSKKPATRSKSRAKPRAGVSGHRGPRFSAGPWAPGIVLGLVLVLGWTLYPALRLQYQTSRRMAGLQQQYRSLRDRNEALRAQVAELKTPEGVEKAARSNLGYTKSGEHVYIVMPDESEVTTAEAPITAAGRTAVQVVLDALFGVAPPASEDIEP